ncbi:uncharacterized protein LOC126184098 [Schistocerca cancellata]|uniref:uncharacterized protein LOC126184098 n=1 Tax=Schistocerca cancellata TaxID=274614 RepID=UPI0021189F7E|nr:uncharacterized protein LOC126184098 [Schistocerca cancellata]
MKIARALSLFKKRDHMCPNNYRPVSLLPIFPKIIERIIFVKLMAFFNKNSIINGRQLGFQKEKSTVSAAFELINILSAGLDQELDVRVVESAKFLGITEDSCLGWKDHISNISNEISTAAIALR